MRYSKKKLLAASIAGILFSANTQSAELLNESIYLDSVIANGNSYSVRLDNCGIDCWHLATATLSNYPGMDAAFVDGIAYVPELGLKLIYEENWYFKSVSMPKGIALTKELSDIRSAGDALYRLKRHYGDYPIIVNPSAGVWMTTQIPQDQFVKKEWEYSLSPDVERPGFGVGFGCNYTAPNGDEWVFYQQWAYQQPQKGASFAVKYSNGEASLSYQPIGGATHCFSLGDGRIFIAGYDEGKYINKLPDGRIDGTSQSWIFDTRTEQWSESDLILANHNGIEWDWDNDGDNDIVVTNITAYRLGVPYDANLLLIENTEKGLVPKSLTGGRGWNIMPTAAAPIARNEYGFSLAVLETNFQWLEWDGKYKPERCPANNHIITLSPDLSKIIDLYDLPKPYFEREELKTIQSNWGSGGWECGVSHDVAASSNDLDGDGDQDLIISSLIWSDEHPEAILQILINENGKFVDETDSRLFNFITASASAHRFVVKDVNGDGAPDIITEGGGTNRGDESLNDIANWTGSTRVLLNDGAGYFATVINQQVNVTDFSHPLSQPHSESLDGKLSFSNLALYKDVRKPSAIILRKVELKDVLSTGPYGIDPKYWGVSGYNEFYYLRNNPDVADAISKGEYLTGLEHYIKFGAREGRKATAVK